MSDLTPSSSSSELLGFSPRSLGEVFKVLHDEKSGSKTPKQSVSQEDPSKQDGKKFSDKDIDLILKKSNIEVSKQNRLLARFFLRHHIVLDRDLFNLTKQLIPKTPQGAQADAFIAALSKLPLERLKMGFEILQSTLMSAGSTFGESLSQIKGFLSDMASESFHLKTFPMDVDAFRKALNDEIQFLTQTLEKPQNQIEAMVERMSIAKRLASLIRFAKNFQQVLKNIPNHESYKMLEQLSTRTLNSAKRALNILLTDSILSREDSNQNLHQQGACHSLGIACHDMTQAGRLWVQDRDNPSSRVLDPNHLKLFFRWSTEELGVVEAEVEVENEQLQIGFASEHNDVIHSFNQEQNRLKERLYALGYDVDHLPTQNTLKFNKPERHIHKKSQDFMKHLDTKA